MIYLVKCHVVHNKKARTAKPVRAFALYMLRGYLSPRVPLSFDFLGFSDGVVVSVASFSGSFGDATTPGFFSTAVVGFSSGAGLVLGATLGSGFDAGFDGAVSLALGGGGGGGGGGGVGAGGVGAAAGGPPSFSAFRPLFR